MKNKFKDIIKELSPLQIMITCFIGIFFITSLVALIFLGNESGIEFVHKHTNVICNIQYNDDIGSWGFQGNGSGVGEFIDECQRRGIGK